MANDEKLLTQEQKAAFVDWINSKAKSHECPVCGENDWTVGNYVVNVMTEDAFSTGRVYPQVLLSCRNCAFVRYFMAIQIGIVDKKDDDSESEEISDG